MVSWPSWLRHRANNAGISGSIPLETITFLSFCLWQHVLVKYIDIFVIKFVNMPVLIDVLKMYILFYVL